MSPYFRNLLKSIGHDYMAPDARVYNTKQYLDGGRVGFGNGGGNFAAIERKKEKEVLLKKLIEDANKQDKYFTQKSIAEKAEIKTPSHYTETFKTNKLMTATEKMDRVLIDMLADDKPLNDRFVNIIRERVGGFNSRETLKKIKETPTFKTIASQGGDFLTRTTNMPNFTGLNLSQQLKRAVDIQIGQPTYIGTSGIKNRFYSPASVTMENARKSWNQNKGKGDVQFFDSKGKPIKWEYGVKLPIQEVSFKYKNKTHKYGDLVDSTYIKKYFPELQETVINANKFKASKVDNPFIPGEKITVRDLTKEISKRGYKNNPKWGTIDILHGPNGVKGEPFTNLRYNTSDINQMELAFSNSLKAGNLNQAQYDQSIKNLNSSFEGLTGADNEKAIVQRLTTQGEKINKGTFYGFGELKERNLNYAKKLKDLGFKCTVKKANGGPASCNNPLAYLDDIKKQQALAKTEKGPQAAKALKKINAGRKIFSAVLGPEALALELALIVPFAVADYKSGLPNQEILSNATLGLFGKSRNRRRDELAVKQGYDTKELKRSRDFADASKKYSGDILMEDTQMSPDDLYQFPQQYNKSEEDFYKAIDPYAGNKKIFNRDVKRNEDIEEMMKLEDQRKAGDIKRRAQKSMEGPIDSFFATGGITGLLKK